METRRIDECKVISFQNISEDRGNITIITGNKKIPFEIKRVFYIYKIPENTKRGNHANRTNIELIVPLSGSLDVNLDDGFNKKIIHLENPEQGLIIPPMIWASETNYEKNTICLVLCSEEYDEKKYFKNYNEFLKEVS